MKKKDTEHLFVGNKPKIANVLGKDENFAEMWKKMEHCVGKTIRPYTMPGVVGLEREDLLQIGQEALLHAMRTHRHTEKCCFRTYFYHELLNRLRSLRRVYNFPTRTVEGVHPVTGKKKKVNCFDDDSMALKEAALQQEGYVTKATKRYANSRRYPGVRVDSLDREIRRDTDNGESRTVTLGDTLALRQAEGTTPLGAINLLRTTLRDPHLRKLAVWLYTGHRVSGKDGIKKRFGMSHHAFLRDMERVRMLLSGVLGVQWDGLRAN